MTGFWDNADVIHVYTRAQALLDGVLVPVLDLVPDEPNFAREAGWRVHVALTSAVANIVIPTDREREEEAQDVKGRLWDLLNMARTYARPNQQESIIPCIFVLAGRPEYGRKQSKTLKFKVHCGPGDDGQPVVTIMLPNED